MTDEEINKLSKGIKKIRLSRTLGFVQGTAQEKVIEDKKEIALLKKSGLLDSSESKGSFLPGEDMSVWKIEIFYGLFKKKTLSGTTPVNLFSSINNSLTDEEVSEVTGLLQFLL